MLNKSVEFEEDSVNDQTCPDENSHQMMSGQRLIDS